MNMLDWVIVCIGAFWILRGLMRGAISQIFGIAGIFIGFLVASHQYLQVSVFITGQFHSISSSAALPLSFILLFLCTWFTIAVVGSWIVRIVRSAGLGFIDRLWGAMIGFCKALLFAIVTISVLTLFSTGGNAPLLAQSKLAPGITEASKYLFKIAPSKVQEELSKKQNELKKLVSERTSTLLDSFFGQSSKPKEKGGTNKE
jgi:membrane protein required for colicin V production